jgi:hypothetical protein
MKHLSQYTKSQEEADLVERKEAKEKIGTEKPVLEVT